MKRLKGVVWYYSLTYSAYFKDTIDSYNEEIEMYWLKNATDFFHGNELFKSKKECRLSL